jgi:hypothetical protein
VLVSSQGDPNPNSTTFIDDGVIYSGEYSAVYTGGGSGFGGTLGSGAIYMDTDGLKLYIGIAPGAAVNDNFVLHLDTRAGGFTDADMNDTGDPGRNLLTNLTRDVDDPFPILPDFGVVAGQFGEVSFELTTGSLNFLDFQNDQTGGSATLAREFAIPLATLGNPTAVDFFATYGSDTNYMSNESIPGDTFNAGPNPGFDNNGTFAPLVHSTYDQFLVPEPASLGLLLLSASALFPRRRAR